jgi:hypothetical protein
MMDELRRSLAKKPIPQTNAIQTIANAGASATFNDTETFRSQVNILSPNIFIAKSQCYR